MTDDVRRSWELCGAPHAARHQIRLAKILVMTKLTVHDLRAARTSNHWAEYVAGDFRWLWATVDQCQEDPWRFAEIKRQLHHSVNKYTEPRLARQLRFRETQLEIYLALLWAKPLGLRPTNPNEHASRFVGVDDLTLLNPTSKRRILDHAYYWRTGGGPLDRGTGFVITTHPYYAFDDYRRDAAEVARKVGALARCHRGCGRKTRLREEYFSI